MPAIGQNATLFINGERAGTVTSFDAIPRDDRIECEASEIAFDPLRLMCVEGLYCFLWADETSIQFGGHLRRFEALSYGWRLWMLATSQPTFTMYQPPPIIPAKAYSEDLDLGELKAGLQSELGDTKAAWFDGEGKWRLSEN